MTDITITTPKVSYLCCKIVIIYLCHHVNDKYKQQNAILSFNSPEIMSTLQHRHLILGVALVIIVINLHQLKNLAPKLGLNKHLQQQKLLLSVCKYFMAQKNRKLVNIWQENGNFLKHNRF